MFASWFRSFFTGWLPPEDVHCIVDAYLSEGSKVLMRYGLALLKINKRKLKATRTASEFDKVLRRYVARAVINSVPGGAAALGIAPALAREIMLPVSSPAAGPGAAATPGHGALASVLGLGHHGGEGAHVIREDGCPPYSFELLRKTAFEGLTQLSRDTISKLMERYLAANTAGQTPAIAASASASGGPDGASQGGHVAQLTLRGSNSILTVGDPGASVLGDADTFTRGMGSGVSVGRAGGGSDSTVPLHHWQQQVRYDDTGLAEDPLDDTSAPAPWYNQKVVGIGSRLVTHDFSPMGAARLRQVIVAACTNTGRALYRPQARGEELLDIAWTMGGPEAQAPSGSSGTGGAGKALTSSASASALAKGEEPAELTGHSWLQGLFGGGSAGMVPSAQEVFGRAPRPRPPLTLPAAAFSLACSPHLASLSTLLPGAVSHYNWACVYSTDVHGWSLPTLYAKAQGFGPTLLVMQASLRQTQSAPGAVSAATSSGAGAGANVSKLIAAFSSKKPVFGFYSSQGMPGLRSSGGKQTWLGSMPDFAFQLYPEINRFGVSNAESESIDPSATGPDGAPATFYSDSLSGADLRGSGQRTRLFRERFLLCSPEFCCVGGNPNAPGSNTLLLHSSLQTATASRDFLLDMSVPDLPPATSLLDELPLDVTAIEVYAFVDRHGYFLSTPDTKATAAGKSAYRDTLEKWWVSE
jgi:hypothetical protein